MGLWSVFETISRNSHVDNLVRRTDVNSPTDHHRISKPSKISKWPRDLNNTNLPQLDQGEPNQGKPIASPCLSEASYLVPFYFLNYFMLKFVYQVPYIGYAQEEGRQT